MSEIFKHYEIGDDELEDIETIRGHAMNLEATIAMRCKPSREKSLAMTKLEECVMWAGRALARHGSWDGE